VLDHPSDRRAIEVTQIRTSYLRGDEARIDQMALRAAHELVLEIDRDLEELAELRVQLAEQVIDVALAEHHDLHIQRDRLGLQRQGADEAGDLGERLDADLGGLQETFQGLPGEGLHQQLERIDDQIAAVGLVQRAGADHGEVRLQRAQVGAVLDATDQLMMRRQIRIDDRGAAVLVVPEEHVDPVALMPGRAVGVRRDPDAEQRRLLVVIGQKLAKVLDHVRLDLPQIVDDGREIAVLLAEGLDQALDGGGGHLAIERFDPARPSASSRAASGAMPCASRPEGC
jgi:hypothetical protein